MEPVKLLALDLDGTLLNSKKELTPRTRAALYAAAEAAVEIVPTTGRFFGAMPEAIRTLPFLHYAITVNSARSTTSAGTARRQPRGAAARENAQDDRNYPRQLPGHL